MHKSQPLLNNVQLPPRAPDQSPQHDARHMKTKPRRYLERKRKGDADVRVASKILLSAFRILKKGSAETHQSFGGGEAKHCEFKFIDFKK